MNLAALEAAGEIQDWESPALCGWGWDVEVEADEDAMARVEIIWVVKIVLMVSEEML